MRIQSEVESESASGTPMVRLGGFVLLGPGERVVVAAVAEMQEAANGHEEIERGVEGRAQPGREELGFVGPAGSFFHGGDEGEPVREIVIAQAAGAIFDVGLEVKNGVAEFVVAGAREIGEALHDRARFARDELRNRLVVQAGEERAIAGEIAAIEQRNREFDVVRQSNFSHSARERVAGLNLSRRSHISCEKFWMRLLQFGVDRRPRHGGKRMSISE